MQACPPWEGFKAGENFNKTLKLGGWRYRVPEANPSRVCGNKARRQAASSEGDESPRHPQFRHSRPEQSCSKVGASSLTEDQEMMTVY
jgi:hypothetical protein